MQIICPNCQFKRELHSSQLPANATHATCPKCSEKFTILPQESNLHTDEETEEARKQRAHSIYKEEAERAEYKEDLQNSTQKDYNFENVQFITMVPWEIPGNTPNLFYKFYSTILRVLTSAPLFFATMLKTYPIQKALIFYILVGMIQFIAKMITFRYSMPEIIAETPEMQAFYDVLLDPNTFLIGIAISPFILCLQAFIISFIFFLTIKLIQPQSANYHLIIRIVCYSSAAGIVSVVPIIGDYIYIPWMIFNFLLACRYTLNMSLVKSCLTIMAFALFSLAALLLILPII